MEDSATAEISRAQVWQWIHHQRGILEDGTEVTEDLFNKTLDEELEKIKTDIVGPERWEQDEFVSPPTSSPISTDDVFVEFLTFPRLQVPGLERSTHPNHHAIPEVRRRGPTTRPGPPATVRGPRTTHRRGGRSLRPLSMMREHISA